MKKIAVVAHAHHPVRDPYAGGLEKHTHMLCKRLSELGHEVTLFAKTDSTEDGYRVWPMVPADFDFHPQPAYSFRWSEQEATVRRFVRKALRNIEQSDFDVVINNSLNAATMEWDAPIPVLTVLHTPVLPLLKKGARLAAAHPLKTFASVSAANAVGWNELVQNIHVVHNGVDIEPRSGVTHTDELRWIARITPEKGLHDAIYASRISGRDLAIAGPISNVTYFDEVIRPLLGDSIRYVGHLSRAELPDFYGSGAVSLATPMWEEPFGLVVAESLVCGTPVAAYARGAMAELIPDSVGALAVADKPEQLAQAIEVAAGKDRSTCARFGIANFSVATMVDRYIDLFDILGSQHALASG